MHRAPPRPMETSHCRRPGIHPTGAPALSNPGIRDRQCRTGSGVLDTTEHITPVAEGRTKISIATQGIPVLLASGQHSRASVHVDRVDALGRDVTCLARLRHGANLAKKCGNHSRLTMGLPGSRADDTKSGSQTHPFPHPNRSLPVAPARPPHREENPSCRIPIRNRSFTFCGSTPV